jgi:hypothetical protein
MMASRSIRQAASKSPIRELPSLENCRPDADATGGRTKPGRDKRDDWRRWTIPLNLKAAIMKIHSIRILALGTGTAVGLVMLALSPSPSLAQTHPRHHAHRSSVQPRSPGYGFSPGAAQDPEAAAMSNAQKLWPGRPLCDDGGYRIRPCDLSGGGGGAGGGGM